MLNLILSREADGYLWLSYLLSALIVIFVSTPIHEFAHAFAAVKLGDPTPKYRGRKTINPFAHIDYIGSLLIVLFGFGWAKPVEVNSRNFNNPKRDMAITAFAGPLSNVILGFIGYLILKLLFLNFAFEIVYSRSFAYYVYRFLNYFVQINISLAVFNLIPIPPLDGSKILAAFLPNRTYYMLMQYERYFPYILILLVVTDVLNTPINFLFDCVIRLFELLTFWI